MTQINQTTHPTEPLSTVASFPSLSEKNVFITGGATGIGAAMVTAFQQQGANVAFIDLDTSAAKELAEQLSVSAGKTPWFKQVDVSQVDCLQQSITEAAESLGSIDVLVNNVANDRRHSASEVNQTSWRECMAVNLDASFFAAQKVAEGMIQQASGSIINMSSINALLAPANMAGYVTAKSGVNGMTKALASEFGQHNIRVNAILPGWVVTQRQLDTWLTPEAEQEWSKHVSLKQRLEAQDIANLALFLAADESRMITGQCFTIDAGRT